MLTRSLSLLAMLTLAFPVVVGSARDVQQQPSVALPRQRVVPPIPVGEGSISGRVTDAHTGASLRGVRINLTGKVRQTARTDIEGRYQFLNLPAGQYRVFADPGPHRGGYQPVMYGSATFPSPATGLLGNQILLEEDGQSRDDVDIALPRLGVITGRIIDSRGEAASSVQVSAYLLLPGRELRTVATAASDDLGRYRLFGLVPGEYVVMAAPAPDTDIQTRIEGEATGFAPTYAPGTQVRSEAMRLRVGAGTEVAANIRLSETRLISIGGRVMSSKGTLGRNITVMLFPFDGPGTAIFSTSPSDGGTFSIRNVPAGRYELVARWALPNTHINDPRLPPIADLNQEYVSLPLEVSTTDLEDVVLVTEPSPVITGQIIFDEKPPLFHQAVISVQTVGRVPVVGRPQVQVKNREFTIRHLFAPVTLRASFPGGPTWGLKAVLLRGQDITDVPTMFTADDSGHLQVIFTARAAGLEGTVVGDDGKPTGLAGVMVFTQDRSAWGGGSSHYRQVRSLKDGKYTINGLRPGGYFVAAVPLGLSASLLSVPSVEFLESLSIAATPITLVAGETHNLDLAVVRVQQ